MNTPDLAIQILENLGGIKNIENMSVCKTRLRVNVFNKELVNVENIKNLDAVLGVVPFGFQIQLVLGPKTGELADIFFNKIKINKFK